MSDATHLLIIDDEDITIQSCLEILKDSGYEIETAKSGEEGLSKLNEHRYDVVIVSLRIPGIDGIEVLKRIKEKDPTQLVLVMASSPTVETARNCLKMGAFDYLPKPFAAIELREVLTKAVINHKKGKALDQMAIVAHEFKSPLTTIISTTHTLYGGYFGKLTPEQQKGIETIMRNCAYLQDIVRCHMDLSKIEDDNLELQKIPLDLVKDVVAPVVDTPEYQNNLKGMTVSVTYADLPPITGNADMLRIVVNNLLNNAIKYGRAQTEVQVKVYRAGHTAVLSVYNEGPGASSSEIENLIFKRFERLKQKGTEGIKGCGLGLYICKQIIEKHHGRIEAFSEPEQNIEFRVSLNFA